MSILFDVNQLRLITPELLLSLAAILILAMAVVKDPLVKAWVPGLSALVSLGLMAGLPRVTWERLLIWMAIGLVLYFAYGYRHSVLRRAMSRPGAGASPGS